MNDEQKNHEITPVRYITIKHGIQSNISESELRERFDKIFGNTAIIVDISYE